MHVDVIPTIEDLKIDEILFKTVIVIDTLRSTSSILSGLSQGAQAIFPVETIGQANSMHKKNPSTLLAGERQCKKIAGFALGNSPTEWASVPLRGKTIVFTSTNGTRAFLKCAKADQTYIGAFLNGKACVEQAVSHHTDITILCAGSRSKFAIEDGLTAGYFVFLMREVTTLSVNDLGLSLCYAYQATKNKLIDVIQQGETGKRLSQLGFVQDIEFCCQTDKYAFAAMYQDQVIVRVL